MSSVTSPPALPAGLPDPETLSRMASQLFALLPGVQAPGNIAPAGSPLASPAGLGPSVPGTPIPQGQIPGSNLLPAAPTSSLPSLANRAPALLPHAQAGNGVPDTLYSVAPAYEPRAGGSTLGVPQAAAASAPAPAASTATPSPSAYYFLGNGMGHPPLGSSDDSGLDALSRQPFAAPIDPFGVTAPTASAAPATSTSPAATTAPAVNKTPALAESPGAPQFYFVDAVRLPNGYVTPAKPGRDAAPGYAASAHPAFDVQAVRRDFPILQERVNGRQMVWFDNAATTHKPQAVIDRLSHFYAHENSNIHRAAHELAARATDAYEGAR